MHKWQPVADLDAKKENAVQSAKNTLRKNHRINPSLNDRCPPWNSSDF